LEQRRLIPRRCRSPQKNENKRGKSQLHARA
jgi:hypothetical protein